MSESRTRIQRSLPQRAERKSRSRENIPKTVGSPPDNRSKVAILKDRSVDHL